MHNRLIELILFYPLFLFSLSFHESAHAYMSDRFGDSTARFLGRISLSPFPHMDIVGTLLLPVFGILTGAPVIGWGKPVPVVPHKLRGGEVRRCMLWVAAAGPISNFILALCFAGCAHGLLYVLPSLSTETMTPGSFSATAVSALFMIFETGVVLNLGLAFFNLLPLPPLDGGSVLRGILPYSLLGSFDNFSRYGFIILLVLFATGLLRYLLFPVFYIASYLLPT